METNLKQPVKELLAELEHFQAKIVSMQDAIDGYRAAMQEIKSTLMMAIANATMGGKLILNPGKHPYIISGYVVMIDFRHDTWEEEHGQIFDLEATELQVIDDSLFNTVKP